MKTDVKEKDGSYILDIDLPGFRKEDIKAELNDGYLTISADRSYEREENPRTASSSEGNVSPAAARGRFSSANR